MKLRPGILAEILTGMALILAPAVKADDIFTLQIGYDSPLYYNGYAQDSWPDYDWYAFWPFFAPVYYSYYSPFYYSFYYPVNYSVFYYPYPVVYYQPPVIHFYYVFNDPWYSCPYYGRPYQNRYYAPAPDWSHERHEQRLSLLPNVNTSAPGTINDFHAATNQPPVTTLMENPHANMKTGGRTVYNSHRDISDAGPADKNIKILNMKQAGSAPMVTSPSLPARGKFARDTGNTAMLAYAAASPRYISANRTTTVADTPPARRYGYTSNVQPSLRHSFSGMDQDQGPRHFPARQPAADTARGAVIHSQPPVILRGATPEGRQQQNSLRQQGGRSDQRQTMAAMKNRRPYRE